MSESGSCLYKGILLASASPRRLALMQQLAPHIDIDVCASDIDEERYFDCSAGERSRRLAEEKARAVLAAEPERCQGRLLLAADTDVVLDGEVFGKAGDAAQATAMLMRLSGRSHQVVTAYCLLDPASGHSASGIVETDVHFLTLDESLIAQYVATQECFGKAGAYAIQGRGAALIRGINGSYSNVVGLPLETIAAVLHEEFQWRIWG